MPRLLLPATIVAAVLAFCLGWFYGPELSPFQLVGEIYLRLLKVLVIPMVVASLITGVTGIGDVRRLGGLGLRTLAYYLMTMGLAVALGMTLANLIAPGRGLAVPSGMAVPSHVPAVIGVAKPASTTPFAGQTAVTSPSSKLGPESKSVTVADLVRSFFPENLFRALNDGDLLPVIVFTLIFAAVLTTLGNTGQPLTAFFEALNQVIMKMVRLVMVLTPLGVFGLIAGRLAVVGGGAALKSELTALASYVFTVVAGLTIHGLITLPGLYVLFRRKNPLKFFYGMLPALTVAFSTASSNATLPVSMACLADKNRVNPQVVRFVLPLGATVNMNGTALYEAVAAMFIAQAYGIALDPGQQVLLFVLATLAAIGAAGIPEAGLVTMVLVLSALHLPLEGIGLLLAVDWFLDRCRTSVNVWDDAVGAGILERWAGNGLIAKSN